jgi:hypothetical protein
MDVTARKRSHHPCRICWRRRRTKGAQCLGASTAVRAAMTEGLDASDPSITSSADGKRLHLRPPRCGEARPRSCCSRISSRRVGHSHQALVKERKGVFYITRAVSVRFGSNCRLRQRNSTLKIIPRKRGWRSSKWHDQCASVTQYIVCLSCRATARRMSVAESLRLSQ